MRNLLCLILLLLSSIVSSAQEIHFYDVHGKKISKEQFEKQRDSRVNLALSFQKGKTTETRLFLRSKTGFISQEVLNKIISNLQTVTGKSIDRSEMMIINYHQGKDRCNSSGSGATLEQWKVARAKYRRQLERLGQGSPYYMYASKEGIRNSYGFLQWYPDLDFLIEKTFFKYKYPCGSFVIIKPDGEYIAQYGEYSLEQVIKQAKNLLK
ncbi:MAG: hypothetical protein WBJ10_06345 [Daejeonella sp.]|uniref:hypothetical protein n=1 Tax=Daejeonella sp. TaxID=2805397 RepID=UPI003C70A41E